MYRPKPDRRVCWQAFVAATCFTLLLTPLAADEIAYSNLGPNDEIDTNNPPVLIGKFGSNPNSNSHFAQQFTAEATGFVTTVDMGISLSNPGQDDFMEVLLWENSGNLPGNQLWSGRVRPIFSAEVYSANSSGGSVELIEGQTYWVSARAENGTGAYLWYRNALGINGNFTFDSEGGTNWRPPNSFTEHAFRVNVRNIPEPASASVMALASLVLLRRRRRR